MSPPRKRPWSILRHLNVLILWINHGVAALGAYLGFPGPAPEDRLYRMRRRPAHAPPLPNAADRSRRVDPEAATTLEIGGVI